MPFATTKTTIEGVHEAAQGQEQLTKAVPTLFLGLGGSGKNVMMRLRKRYHDRFLAASLPYTRFLFIDSDMQWPYTPRGESSEAYEPVQPAVTERTDCALDPTECAAVFDKIDLGVESRHLTWLKPQMRTINIRAIAPGVGTHRQLGRLAFFLKYKEIRQALERQIVEVMRDASGLGHDRCYTDRIEVVIATSLAGGTGAGMFIDVAYLVRDILNSKRLFPKPLIAQSITILAFLPSVYQDLGGLYPRLQQNAYAALQELEHYGTPRTEDDLFLGDAAGDAAAADRRRIAFRKSWDGRADETINDPGWTACYLIDSANSLDPTNPLKSAEIFQMAADYLFLDFESYELATAKRSARSNLIQFKDRWRITSVLKQEPPRGSAALDEEGAAVVYATQSGLTFSSFGLAEIAFDVNKLYLAAGYRLAGHLARHLWIGQADRHQPDEYRAWAQEDLYDARPLPDQPTPCSFRRTELIERMMTGRKGSWLHALNEEIGDLGRDEAGLDRLVGVLAAHRKLLGPGGAVVQTIEENQAALRGTPSVLGEYRQRLRDLLDRRLNAHGVVATQFLLQAYQQRLNETRENLKNEPGGDLAGLTFDRLRDAGAVWRPCRGRAVAIEARRVREALAGSMTRAYRRAAAERLDPVLVEVNKYIGAPNQRVPDELTQHRTLQSVCAEARHLLERMADRLKERYDQAASDSRSDAKRKRLLSLGWDAEKYDEKINKTLVTNADVGLGLAGPTRLPFTFHWRKLEQRVLARMREIEDLPEVPTLAALLRLWRARDAGPDGGPRIAERLARACRDVLREGGGLHLDDEAQGNAVDLLFAKYEEDDRKRLVADMVVAGAPYFCMTSDYLQDDPKHENLYGQKTGSDPRNADQVFRWVVDVAESKSGTAAGTVSEPIEADHSALFLVREVAGFPLQRYAQLDELHDAYLKTPTHTKSNDECHIDYRAAWEDLPDIQAVEPEVYGQIRDQVDTVLLAMMLGVLDREDRAYVVRVPKPFGPGTTAHRLGTRLSRVIRHACSKEQVRAFLVRTWEEWQSRAAPRQWAALYASAVTSYDETGRNVSYTNRRSSPAPIHNCLTYILERLVDRLDATEEGRRLRARLERRGQAAADDGAAPLLDQIRREALRRVSPEVPIYRVDDAGLGRVAWPEAEPVAPGPQPVA